MEPEDGPWVSLPSKQYPDKVYYFNVSTGVSSWEKPEHYCEPVDDSKTLQCLTKPTTPERTENRSYIVESLSPNSSPRKPQVVSKSKQEIYEKKDNENKDKSSTLESNRSNVKNHPYKNDFKKTQTKDGFNDRLSRTERNFSSYHSTPMQSKQIMKGERSNYTNTLSGRSQCSETQLQELPTISQKYSQFEYIDKLSYRRSTGYENYRQSQTLVPFKNRSDLPLTRSKMSDASAIYGTASLRLECLRRKLAEERKKKYKPSQPDWAENSREREWQTHLLKQRNSLDSGSRLSGIPLHPSASSDSRKDNYFSDSKSQFSKIENVGLPSRTSTAGSLSESSEQLRLSGLRKKLSLGKDGFDSVGSSTNVLPKTSYSNSFSETVANSRLKLQSSLYQARPYSNLNSEEYSYSSDFNRKLPSVNFSGCVSKTSASSLTNRYNHVLLPDAMYKTPDVGKNNPVIQSNNNSLKKSNLLEPVSKTCIIDQYSGHQKILQDQTYEKTDFIKDDIHYLKPRKDSLSNSEFPSNSKLTYMEWLNHCKYLLLKAKALQKQPSGQYSHLSESSSCVFSKIPSTSKLPSLSKNSSLSQFRQDTWSLCTQSKLNTNKKNTEEYFISGNVCDSPKNSKSDIGYEVKQRKLTHPNNFIDDKISNLTKSSRVHEKDIGAKYDNKNRCYKSWAWNPPGLVRDYNHKRVADCIERTSTSTNSYAKAEIKEEKYREKINLSHIVQQNCIDTQHELSSKYSKYENPVKSSSGNRKTQCSLRKEENLKHQTTSEQSFGYSQTKHNSRAKPEVIASSNTESECYLQNINADVKLFKPKCQSSEQSPQSVSKWKSHESKGGIAKINRRVQKQLRNVPKLIYLPSSSIPTKMKSSSLKSENTSDLLCGSESHITYEEEMDWEPIEPEKVVLHVEALRREGSLQNTVNSELVNLCSASTSVSSEWFIVLDTNVLLSHLGFLNELLNIKDNELGMPTLFIPWIALQELDNLKSTNRKPALHHQARKAVNFLYENLLCRHPRVQGQPKSEADEHYALEPDDSILQCSINLQKHSNKVLLLTNDRNLFNKATISGVECCSATKLVEELEKRRRPSLIHGSLSSPTNSVNETSHPFFSVIDDTKQCVGIVLEEVLRTEMVMAYDRKWTEFVARKPPWNLNDILFCLLKHWTSVFHLVLPSAARELIEKIRFFINNEAYENSLKTVGNLLKTCVSLMHLVSSLCYKQYVDDALNTLRKLQDSLKGQVSTSVVSVLPVLCPGVNTCSTASKADDTASTVSGHPHSTRSDSANVPSAKGVRYTKPESAATVSSASASGSGGCGGRGSIIHGECKDSEDDCLSLYASSFSESVVNNQSSDRSIERGKELAHIYLNKIWEKVAVYCGMLCDVMGVEPCVPYQRPEPFPTLETLHQNLLYFVKCVGSLLRCIEGILAIRSNELCENSPLLLNLYVTIKESLSLWNEPGETLLPRHVLVYCIQNDTRQQLQCGKEQFQQFETILNRAVKFFLAQIPTSGLPL